VFEVSRCRDKVCGLGLGTVGLFGTCARPSHTVGKLLVVTGLDVHGPCQVDQLPTRRMRRHGPWGDDGRCIGVCSLGSCTAGIGGGGAIVSGDPP
jgi:hypothetical protein